MVGRNCCVHFHTATVICTKTALSLKHLEQPCRPLIKAFCSIQAKYANTTTFCFHWSAQTAAWKRFCWAGARILLLHCVQEESVHCATLGTLSMRFFKKRQPSRQGPQPAGQPHHQSKAEVPMRHCSHYQCTCRYRLGIPDHLQVVSRNHSNDPGRETNRTGMSQCDPHTCLWPWCSSWPHTGCHSSLALVNCYGPTAPSSAGVDWNRTDGNKWLQLMPRSYS